MLNDQTLFGEIDKVAIAIERLRNPVQFIKDPKAVDDFNEMMKDGYYLAFSGGKDSVVIKALADMAGVKYDAHYNVTGIDPPEVVQFIRREHPDVQHDKNPKGTFFKLAVQKGFPLRQARWCCAHLKERGGEGRVVITGIRWAESPRRKAQRRIMDCGMIKYIFNPVIDWTDENVWEFIRHYNIPYCKLYDEGWTRIGCMLCPFSSLPERRATLIQYPKVIENFRRCFRRIYDKKKSEGKTSVDRWKDGDDMFDWWSKTR